MKNSLFCHLHNHDEYSQLDGFGSPDKWCKKASELGFKYLGNTNHANIDSLIQFQKACEKYNIEPVMGCEAYIVPDASARQNKFEQRGHISLFIKSEKGFRNLCQLLTQANLYGFYQRPRIDYKSLLEYCEGLVILTGCSASFLSLKGGQDFFFDLYDKIGNDLYLEIMPHNIKRQHTINEVCCELKRETDKEDYKIKLVATNDCHYPNKEDWEVQKALLGIQYKRTWNEPNLDKYVLKGLHLRTADEMVEKFQEQNLLSKAQYISAMRNTLEVAKKCSQFRIKKQDISLPDVPGFEDKDENIELKKLCISQIKKRKFGKKYMERFKEEFALISSKNFSKYFLIVYEIVNWCKENNIMIGPGRGSVGGSLIAHLIGITQVDPLEYGLLFSRFLNKDRNDYPDIDIDFEDQKRYRVQEHLAEIYGENHVANISTFLKIKGRTAIRDIGRVFALPNKDIDTFAKSLENPMDKSDRGVLKRAVKNTYEGRQFKKNYPLETKLAVKLEGTIRGYSQHAAAMILSSEDLTLGTRGNFISKSGNVAINWEMEDSEYIGLMKLDILGLKTLSILSTTRDLIKKNHNENIDFNSIDLHNSQVLAEFAEGNNTACFQFNSWGMANLCRDLNIDSFETLVQANALYRPGTLNSGIASNFVQRRKENKWESISEEIEEITSHTYGIPVYQEQVMKIANQIAGMPYTEADKIRKVIGKSKGTKALHEFKNAFVDGCVENKTLDKITASKLWANLEKFGGYGFNRSHSVEYSMIGYWCQWLKLYYPTEFICANLTCGSGNEKEKIIEEARRLGLSLMLPKVGISDAKAWVAKDNILYTPFIEIKGVGEKTADQAVALKKKQQKSGFFNTQKKAGSKLESILDKVGSFDESNEISEEAQKYFDFKVSTDPVLLYPNLHHLIGRDYFGIDFDDILKGKITPEAIHKKKTRVRKRKNTETANTTNIVKKKNYQDKRLLKCKECNLRNQCKEPVLPSKGIYNIAIVGEAPGREEDSAGKGFVGKSGNKVWKELDKYGLKRRLFHVSNTVKCFPSRSKTPDKKRIEACRYWLYNELRVLDCHVILAFGNTGIKYFTDRDSGITNISGTTEWIDKHSLWVCWCLHPAAVLRDPSNEKYFKKGIKNFANMVNPLIKNLK